MESKKRGNRRCSKFGLSVSLRRVAFMSLSVVLLLSLSLACFVSFADGFNGATSNATYYGKMRLKSYHLSNEVSFEHWLYEFPRALPEPNAEGYFVRWTTYNHPLGNNPQLYFNYEVMYETYQEGFFDFKFNGTSESTTKHVFTSDDFLMSQEDDRCYIYLESGNTFNRNIEYTISYDVTYRYADLEIVRFATKSYSVDRVADRNATAFDVLELGVALTGLGIPAEDEVLISNYTLSITNMNWDWYVLTQPLQSTASNGTSSLALSWVDLEQLTEGQRETDFIANIISSIDRALDIELFGSFSLGNIFAVMVFVPLFIFILKRFAGG